MRVLDSEGQHVCWNHVDTLVRDNLAFRKAIRANEDHTMSELVNELGTGAELVQSQIFSGKCRYGQSIPLLTC